jgi:Uncharacterized conserved protein (DUF2164)
MTHIEFSKQVRVDAIASIKGYFQENMPEPIGDLPAGLLLNFFLEGNWTSDLNPRNPGRTGTHVLLSISTSPPRGSISCNSNYMQGLKRVCENSGKGRKQKESARWPIQACFWFEWARIFHRRSSSIPHDPAKSRPHRMGHPSISSTDTFQYQLRVVRS